VTSSEPAFRKYVEAEFQNMRSRLKELDQHDFSCRFLGRMRPCKIHRGASALCWAGIAQPMAMAQVLAPEDHALGLVLALSPLAVPAKWTAPKALDTYRLHLVNGEVFREALRALSSQ